MNEQGLYGQVISLEKFFVASFSVLVLCVVVATDAALLVFHRTNLLSVDGRWLTQHISVGEVMVFCCVLSAFLSFFSPWILGILDLSALVSGATLRYFGWLSWIPKLRTHAFRDRDVYAFAVVTGNSAALEYFQRIEKERDEAIDFRKRLFSLACIVIIDFLASRGDFPSLIAQSTLWLYERSILWFLVVLLFILLLGIGFLLITAIELILPKMMFIPNEKLATQLRAFIQAPEETEIDPAVKVLLEGRERLREMRVISERRQGARNFFEIIGAILFAVASIAGLSLAVQKAKPRFDEFWGRLKGWAASQSATAQPDSHPKATGPPALQGK